MTHAVPARPDRVIEGILLILASVAMLAFGDAFIKLFSANFTLWQIFALRSAIAIPLFFALAVLARRMLKPRNATWVTLRATLLITGWIAYYSALPYLDLAVAAVGVYTNPIITALVTAAFLGDRVTPAQWLGVGLGFAGVVVILNPGGDDFNAAILLAILGAALYSFAMVLTRAKCQDEDYACLAFFLHLAFFAAGLIGLTVVALLTPSAETQAAAPFLLSGWAPLNTTEWAIMALLGVLATGFTLTVARAYQVAPPHIVATFDYAYVAFAVLWGIVFFAEYPGPRALLGMTMIIGAGLLVVFGARGR